MTKEDKDALLQEMLETSAFGVLLERVSAYVVNLRVVAFSDAREDRERIRASDAVNVVRRMFEQVYASAGDSMPPEFRRIFE